MSLPKPYYSHAGQTIYLGDCREILSELPKVDLVLTDPPYPNNANHFCDGIETAKWMLTNVKSEHLLVFWDEMERPITELPLVAVHIWHRSNTNRPDNYEPIYEFRADGVKRASRVFSYPVIAKGLTGCVEATGHPTQKNRKLIADLIAKAPNPQTILDPFMGSGTTLVACKQLGRKGIGIEIEERYAEIAALRLSQEVMDFSEVA